MQMADEVRPPRCAFRIEENRFVLHGKDFKLISGALHYFRIPREYWVDRLQKTRMMGCNTVETYIPWILHEPAPGEFCFGGSLDIEEFVYEASRQGLYVILRPSPYICGEFEFGGMPWWLLTDRNVRVRSSDPAFLEAVDRYYDELIPRLVPLQIDRSGPVIMFQVENEHGYWSNNTTLPEHLCDGLRARGVVQPLITSDGPWGASLEIGKIDGALQTANFGSRADEHFDTLASVETNAPLVCTEFWDGWFDAWGEAHNVRNAANAAGALDSILARGHVNIYMAHGGTNFGFTTGANDKGEYQPDVTSYDYDAPIAEDGTLTEKFLAFKDVISRHAPVEDVELTTPIGRLAPRELPLSGVVALFDALDSLATPVTHTRALTMEELGQGFGYVLYRVESSPSDVPVELDVSNCRDRVLVFCNGAHVETRDVHELNRPVPIPSGTTVVDLLVENQGRVNFGHKMNSQRKGFDGPIAFSDCEIVPVTHYSLPLEHAPDLPEASGDCRPAGPAFFEFTFNLELPRGQYLDSFFVSEGWGKGVVFVNGKNIGRFWDRGPQRNLYIPGPFLNDGLNSIVVFETEGNRPDRLRLSDSPDLGEPVEYAG